MCQTTLPSWTLFRHQAPSSRSYPPGLNFHHRGVLLIRESAPLSYSLPRHQRKRVWLKNENFVIVGIFALIPFSPPFKKKGKKERKKKEKFLSASFSFFSSFSKALLFEKHIYLSIFFGGLLPFFLCARSDRRCCKFCQGFFSRATLVIPPPPSPPYTHTMF